MELYICKNKLSAVFFACALVCTTCVMAQVDSKKLLNQYDLQFAKMDSLILSMGQNYPQSMLFSNSPGLHNSSHEIFEEVTEAQKKVLKSNNGLRLTGQTYIRPGAGISYDTEDPLVAYSAKAQLELGWDFFNSSFYQRKKKLRLISLQGSMDELQFDWDGLQELMGKEHKIIRRINDSYLLGVLREHSKNLELLTQTQKYLLDNEHISSDELLKLVSEKAELDRRIVSILSDSVYEARLPSKPYDITVDTAKLMAHTRMWYMDIVKLELQKQMIDTQQELTNYVSTMQIMPFTRFSYYNRNNARNTHNFDVGVSFRLPLNNETKKKRDAFKAEKKRVSLQQSQIQRRIEIQMKLLFEQLTSYNENIKGEYQRMINLKNYISQRVNSYKNALGDNYSRLQRLQEYNAYLTSWERLLDFQMQRDNRLVDLQSYIIDRPLRDFLIIKQIQ